MEMRLNSDDGGYKTRPNLPPHQESNAVSWKARFSEFARDVIFAAQSKVQDIDLNVVTYFPRKREAEAVVIHDASCPSLIKMSRARLVSSRRLVNNHRHRGVFTEKSDEKVVLNSPVVTRALTR
ncbi:predicted protein [Nematostella vectensis]|uniref:Uncharacterized protein n=1 Tax=Nematostella vectensis TaxID=45351 RepID=A7RS54_NEMVE|nr:predicted protein [Nematostella vectensis]|eukprot:XP_001637749.1 predicted protein [Nematostella vectensis]